MLDVDKQIVTTIYGNNDIARARFVIAKEKKIQYGREKDWVDIEADEVDLGKGTVENPSNPKFTTKWEQWCGITQRTGPARYG